MSDHRLNRSKMILKKLLKNLKKKLYYKKYNGNIYVYKPCMVYISPKSKLEIKSLMFNIQWDDIRIKNNLIPGQLHICDNTNVIVGNVFWFKIDSKQRCFFYL